MSRRGQPGPLPFFATVGGRDDDAAETLAIPSSMRDGVPVSGSAEQNSCGELFLNVGRVEMGRDLFVYTLPQNKQASVMLTVLGLDHVSKTLSQFLVGHLSHVRLSYSHHHCQVKCHVHNSKCLSQFQVL